MHTEDDLRNCLWAVERGIPVIYAGGGIAGLSLALTLHQVGVRCTVYESVPELRPLGVGINLQPNAVRELFDAFEQKKDILHLLERCSRADGIQIFIGEEAGYEVFGDYSVVTAPYSDGMRTLGVLGVIGPTRMAYERVIPIVDVTARMLSSALSS